MLIWKIEVALEHARLALVLGDSAQASKRLDETRELVRATEKPYQPHVPDWPQWQPPEYVGVFHEGEIVGYHRRNNEIEALQKSVDGGESRETKGTPTN